MRLAIDGHGALLHGLQQRGLGLRRRAIDLVRQQERGEDRAFDQREFVALQVENVGAGDVRRHQVGRELNAVELASQHARQRAREQRLGQARHAFDQRMLVGQDHHQRLADGILLADDHLADLGGDALDGRLKLI
jgi:maltoporin